MWASFLYKISRTALKYHCAHGVRTLHSTSGLVVEYIVAIDVTRVRFPAGAHVSLLGGWNLQALTNCVKEKAWFQRSLYGLNS